MEEEKISEKDYKASLKKLILYLRGKKKQVIAEIEKEMKRLQTELVPKTELETAINYMSGAFAGSLN